MFNDRDLGIIGAGAVLSVLCLLLPISFAWKIAAGFFTLVAAILVALLRLGGDGLTLEEWFYRRIRYHLRPRNWTFYQRTPSHIASRLHPRVNTHAEKEPAISTHADKRSPALSWGISVRAGEKLGRVLLAVVGLYFLGWLYSGGAALLGVDLGAILP